MSTQHTFQPKMLGIVCNWCCYGGADLCGVSRFQYPPHIRLVRVMCSARVDMLHILRAFSNGQDGLFIGGCHPGDCHYVTAGNFNAFAMVQVFRRILKHMGIFPERLKIAWVSAAEGIRFANFMNEYTAELENLGPLGKAEGLTDEELHFKLEAIKSIVPYVKLLLMRKMQPLARTEEAYQAFFTSAEFERLFQESIVGELAVSQIMEALREKPLSTAEISQRLHLDPSEVAMHISHSSKHGLVRYDVESNCYALT